MVPVIMMLVFFWPVLSADRLALPSQFIEINRPAAHKRLNIRYEYA